MKGFIFAILITVTACMGNVEAQSPIKWMTWNQAKEQMAKDIKDKKPRKKVMIDMFTDWCGWCKRMDASTFSDENFAKYINENFYAIKFNAEQKEDIKFNETTTYKYREAPNGRGTHELAINLLNGQLSYPSIVFLDENFELIQAVPGYREAAELKMIAAYFASGSYKTTSWDVYKKNYKG